MTDRRLAVISNPAKISDRFAELLTERARRAGWADPVWLETSTDDPGRAVARQAVSDGARRVLAAGGDGTVRAVASGLADSDASLGIIPAGTANLLARNLGIPLTEPEAVDVALGQRTRSLDLVRITTDDGVSDRFAVMAGIGLDAAIMSSSDSVLKDKTGSLAYVVAAARELGREPRTMRIRVDNGPVLRRRAMICLVGNVGAIQGQIELIPNAKPDDGLIDVVVASPTRLRHWIRVAIRLITRRQRSGDRVDQLIGRRVEVLMDEPDEYELDGDTMGSCRRLVAEVEPGALQVCVAATESGRAAR
ncbi:sphingosine kinase [Microlunatus endophyticus]|uniref:Sphingosine kinase n=1 Tax=Microlunatus endophyticus TaxID=1716077 RepID=A0A917S1Y9_9ACTN|nr:diacylglycerol kinase family protein [Microlunatus endophyticus]GGL53134.1 sphingosine kinase [Microlunatus endophyticus]